MPYVLTKLDNSIGTITSNHAEKRHCLSQALIDEMLMALEEFEQGGARVVILRAAQGVNVWSAGHDVRELPEDGRDPLDYNVPLENLLRCVQDFPAPISR